MRGSRQYRCAADAAAVVRNTKEILRFAQNDFCRSPPMPLSGLTIIGETINDSVPSTKKLFDAGDIDGILELARSQDEKGAAYIDVNVGPRPPEFMAEMVREDPRRDGQAAVDRHARPGNRPGRPASLQPGPRRRQEADPQFDQRAAGGNVRSVPDSAVPADPAGFRERGRRPLEALPHRPGDFRGGAAIGPDFPGPLSRRNQRRLHHRPGHRADGQRFGGQHPPPDRRPGTDPRRPRPSPAATLRSA